MSNGEYRFGDATSFAVDHNLLAGNNEPVSAAFVKIYSDGLYVEGQSMLLKMGPAPEDEDNISQLLGIPIKSKW